MKVFKDRLYNFMVRKNGRVWYEYERFVRENLDDHKKNHLNHIIVLLKLNWFYRIKKGKTPYLYWDVPLDPQYKYEKSKNESMTEVEKKNVNSSNKKSKAEIEVSRSDSVVTNKKDIVKDIIVSEYESTKRNTAYSFAMGLTGYDIISFDIFDTLILRKVTEPDHIFMIVGEKLGIYDFFNIRKKAEKLVREQHLITRNNRECTIEDIYEVLSKWTGIDKDKGIKTEIETEYEFCQDNPYMKQVFQIMKQMGKEIYAVSNMYYPKAILLDLLNRCGYSGFKNVLVSCDYQCSKIGGALFKILKNKESDKRIVHIGDSRVPDIQGAKAVGIDAKLYISCREKGNEFRARGFSTLIGSAYYGMINNNLHSGIFNDKYGSLTWEFGYLYGGLTALGYVNWIHNMAKNNKIDSILFLARDGAILKKVYDLIYDDIPSRYLLWSRLSGIRDISVGTREQIIFRIIDENSSAGIRYSDVMNMLGWSDLCDYFMNLCDLDSVLTKENAWLIKEVICNNWDYIVKNSSEFITYQEEYIIKSISNSKKVALVDVGWTGKNDLKLKQIIQKHNPNIDVSIYMIGSLTKVQNPYDIKMHNIECFMFSADTNREIYDTMLKLSTKGLDIVEKLFSASTCSFIGINKHNMFEFAKPEIENYQCYNKLAEGIYDFCYDYYNSYGGYDYFMNISGYDAWCALRKGINNTKLINQIFNETVYLKGINPYTGIRKTKELI